MTETLTDDLLKLRELREVEADAKEAFDDVKTERKRFEAKCKERMEVEQADSIRIDGTLFVPTETIYASVNDRAEFIKWAEENDEGLIEQKERSQVLSQLVREKQDNNEELPPGVTFYVREYISQRAA